MLAARCDCFWPPGGHHVQGRAESPMSAGLLEAEVKSASIDQIGRDGNLPLRVQSPLHINGAVAEVVALVLPCQALAVGEAQCHMGSRGIELTLVDVDPIQDHDVCTHEPSRIDSDELSP